MELRNPIRIAPLYPALTIDIFHPGYSGNNPEFDVLISFEAYDDGGVDFHTAHTACAILANNRWDGYFSRDKHGKLKVEPSDGILRDKSYYFCLPSSDPSTDRYPVVARFVDWRFPHNNLPPIWTSLQDQLLAKRHTEQARSGHCCLSDCADAVENAHLVPSTQSLWWRVNRMKRYAHMPLFSTDDINAPANYLPLSCEVHRMFDERHFTFVPKAVAHNATPGPRLQDSDRHHSNDNSSQLYTSNQRRDSDQVSQTASQLPVRSPPEPHGPENALYPQSTLCLVGHIFNSTPSGQLPRRWHNQRLNPLPLEVSVDLLFARFAWTVFSPSTFRYFLDTGKGRCIIVWNNDKMTQEVEEADSERCRAIYIASRARSGSPAKRLRQRDDGSKDSDEAHDPVSYDTPSDVDSAYHDSSQARVDGASDFSSLDEPKRGRKRDRDLQDDSIELKRPKVDSPRR